MYLYRLISCKTKMNSHIVFFAFVLVVSVLVNACTVKILCFIFSVALHQDQRFQIWTGVSDRELSAGEFHRVVNL